MSSGRPTSSWSQQPPQRLTDEQFARLSRQVCLRTGIACPAEKRNEFELKLAEELDAIGVEHREQSLSDAEQSMRALQRFVNRLTVGESYFFRNRPHFDALEQRILPDLIERRRKKRSLRIWSAGCAAGEEPYSLEILRQERFPELADWDVKIVATDINTAFLDQAREATYTDWAFRGVDPELIDKYFERRADGRRALSDSIRKAVEFRWLNLADVPFKGRAPIRQFDLVLCRNVLIYFAFGVADQVVESLIETIAPGGYLLVGHAESFPALGQLEAVFSNATYYYRRTLEGERAATTAPPGRTLSIPGIGVGTLRPSTLPSPSWPGPRAISTDGITQTWSEASPSAPMALSAEQAELEAGLDRARSHADRGEANEALEILEQLAAGAGDLDPRVYFLQAIVFDQGGASDRAIGCLKKALFLHKEFTIAHYYLGVICDRDGDTRSAARSFRNVNRLIERLPDDAEIDEARGLMASRLREIVTERINELERS
jgi:chemotaxis protein methyltransferase CheR